MRKYRDRGTESILGALPPARIFLPLLLAALTLLAGCDTPDYRNVTFKPNQEDPDAYRNALNACFITAARRAQPWGNDFLLRQDVILGRDRAPLPDLAVRLDGHEFRTDRKGFLAIDRLRPGQHSLEVPAGKERRHLAVPIEKGRMTLCLFDLGADGRTVASCTLRPHSFLVAIPYRELAELHRKLLTLLDGAEGREDAPTLEELLDPAFSDSFGGRGDLLKARASLAAAGQAPEVRVRSAVALLAKGGAEVVAMTLADGRPSLCRMTLVSDGLGPFRITSLTGANPWLPLQQAAATGGGGTRTTAPAP